MLTIDSAIVREHGPALLSFARRIMHRREDAEDVVQETWMSALHSVPSFEGRSSLRSWLTKILRRRIADRFRRPTPIAELDESTLFSWESAPEARVDARQTVAISMRTFATLTPLEQRAITLTVQSGDRDQAADALGITRGHLRVLLFRARQKLGAGLDQAGLGEVVLREP